RVLQRDVGNADSGNEPVAIDALTPLRLRSTQSQALLRKCNPDYFRRFWKAYPRRCAIANALRAFARIAPDEALLQQMLDAIEAASRSAQWRKDSGAFIPHPASWLNGQCWLDDIPDEVYTDAQRAAMTGYNEILAEGAGWPVAVDSPYVASRASAIDAFLGFAPTKPDMARRYFEYCASDLPLQNWCSFDWLIRKETYLKIREGVKLNRQSRRVPR
ncbi:MAG: hypothetical protein L0H29_01910, partial [Sinobacteraceae bacterium]|nr:hypothetical protein [Nevskiaceae bacterium]